MKFNELVRLLEREGFKLIKEKGSIRYYGKPGFDSSVLITMAPRKYRQARAMLF